MSYEINKQTNKKSKKLRYLNFIQSYDYIKFIQFMEHILLVLLAFSLLQSYLQAYVLPCIPLMFTASFKATPTQTSFR